MLFGKKSRKGKYVKAKTPEAQKKQQAAIINYYTNKSKEKEKSK